VAHVEVRADVVGAALRGMTGLRPESRDVLLNDVVEIGDPPRPYRVVGVLADRFIMFDLEDRARLPLTPLTFDEFDDEETVKLVAEHQFDASVDEGALTDKRRKRRTKCFEMLAPLLALGDRLFDEKALTAAISAVVKPANGSKAPDRKTVKTTLDRYFRYGMTPTAAMPQFGNLGGKGIRKTRGEKKLGRPRTIGSRPGTNVTPEIEVIFSRGLRRYYLKNRKIDFEKARMMILRDFCMIKRVDIETRTVVHSAQPLFREEDFPSTRQLRFWFQTHENEFEFERERVGRRKYDRDMRGVTGNAAKRAFGPGSRFEIDATIANIYVVSELEPTLVIGRPVIYVIVDVFSKMVVALYVGLEGPSWTGAMMALVNMVTNKKEFCAEFGIDISEDEWPCHHLPEKLLGDRGEIAGRVIEALQANRHVTVESAQAYRPDWKGSVEKMFDLLDCELAPYTDSYVEPDFGERGGKNYVLEACWTIRDVTAAMIDTILRLNNHRTIAGYKRPKQMIADGVDAVPIQMWEWGIARRSGALRRASPQDVAFDVMPRELVKVTAKGIRLRGLYYTCDKAVQEQWTDRARQKGSWDETASYDHRSTTHIYLHVPTSVDRRGYVVCRLTDSDRQYAGYTFAEVARTMREEKARAADRSVDNIEREADSATRKEKIDARARERLGKVKRKPKDVQNRREAFSREKTQRRSGEAFDLGDPVDTTRLGEVVPLLPDSEADDVSEPNIFGLIHKKRTPKP
jgi:hypothetical protein